MLSSVIRKAHEMVNPIVISRLHTQDMHTQELLHSSKVQELLPSLRFKTLSEAPAKAHADSSFHMSAQHS